MYVNIYVYIYIYIYIYIYPFYLHDIPRCIDGFFLWIFPSEQYRATAERTGDFAVALVMGM